MPYVDRLAEDATNLWLVTLALAHAAWVTVAVVWARRASEIQRVLMKEGRSTVAGHLVSDAPVLVGEAFHLRLTTGVDVWVEPRRDVVVRTPTVRPWEREGQLAPGEGLLVEGELRRELSRAGDDYRSAESRWVLAATHVEGLAEGEVSVQRARRSRTLATWGAMSAAVLGYLAVEHALLATRGEVSPGQAQAHVEVHSAEVATGTHGEHHTATSTERSVEVRFRVDGQAHVLRDHLTAEGVTRVSDTGTLPVIHIALAGVTIAQIGERPGLSFFALYAFFAELAIAATILFWIRPVRA